MLDEKKTKKQLLDDIKVLREHLASLQHRQLYKQKSDIDITKQLAWKDFLLGLHEKSHDFTDENLYRYILDEVVRLTNSDIGFLHLVSEDQQSVILTTWNERALQHCKTSHETHYPVAQAGKWVDCLHLKRAVVYNDFFHVPNQKGLPPGHNPIHRFMSVPVIEQGKVRVIFGMGNKPEDYDDEDVFQTQLVANSLQSILTRRYAEKQLRENEERLFLSLQATQDAIWDWDIVQGTGYASPNYFTMLGYNPDEFLMNSEYWWHLIHCDDVQKVREAMDRVMNNPDSGQDSIPSVEFRMKKKTGEWRWILARGKVVTWDREGRPLRMMGTHTDITDRKLAEEALRESEERYRTLFETANDAILLMDRDFIYVDCNPKAMEITHRSRNEIIGHNAYEDSPPTQPDGKDSQAAALSYMKEAVAGRPQKFYWQALREDGAFMDLDVCLNKLTLGGQDFLQVIVKDITEQKQAEKSLRESEGKFKDLVEQSIAGVYLIQDGLFKYVNAKFAEVLGYSMDEMTGKKGAKDIIYEDDLPLVEENLRKRISGELRELHYGFRIKTKNGDVKYAEVYSSRTTYQGKAAVIGTLLDLTERRQMEESLRENEEVFRLLFEKSGDANLLMENGCFIDCNEAALKILGCTDKSQIMNLSLADVSPPKQPDGSLSQERVQAEAARALQQGTNRFDWLHQGFDGELRYLDVILTPISLKGKRLLYVTWRDISQRRKTEQDLLYMNALYSAMQDVSLDGVLVVNDEGQMVSSNARFAEIWGIPDDILTTRSNEKALAFALSKLVNPDDYLQTVMALYPQRDEKSRQEIYLHDGRVLDQYSAPVMEPEGKYYGRIWFFRDITERKRIEEALSQNEATLRSVFNASPIGLCTMKGRVFQSANKAWYDLFGYTEAEIIGHTTRILYENDAEYDRIGRELYENLKDRGLAMVQTRIRRKDGDLRDVIVIAAPLEREYPSHGTVVTIEDITDRMRAEEELKESQRRLFDIIEFLPDATLVIDRYGKILAWNRAIEIMTGVKKEDMLGKGDYEYALPFYGTRRPILIDLALCQDKETEKQYTTIQRWGDVLFGEAHTPNLPPGNIYLSATASVLRDSSGEVIAAIECIRDITERGRLEAQLRQAQKMEAIGTLAGGIAHDFNNILASTIGYTELAIMNIGKPNLLDGYLAQVMKACDRAKNLVNQILVFSRQREQERKPIDMTVAVKEALKLLRASLPSTIKIDLHFPPEPATVMADPTQIHQIVMNLCTNAAQAMRENGGELDVNLFHFTVPGTMVEFNPVFKAGPYVHLVVKDTGHGIDPAIIDKIFDPFFTTKRHQEGTGLGLSVVYGIVNSYDGVIQVKSEPGQGTTFNVYIPATEEIKVASEQKTTEPIPGGHESLLLVDDEELLVQAMENYLGALGYDVVSSTNSPEALYMVQENPHRFDLMITDMTMPHMTGLKLSREVLALNPLLPIILCTGYNESITEEEVKRSGIKEFVLKPVSLQKMAYLIRQVLDMQ